MSGFWKMLWRGIEDIFLERFGTVMENIFCYIWTDPLRMVSKEERGFAAAKLEKKFLNCNLAVWKPIHWTWMFWKGCARPGLIGHDLKSIDASENDGRCFRIFDDLIILLHLIWIFLFDLSCMDLCPSARDIQAPPVPQVPVPHLLARAARSQRHENVFWFECCNEML